MSYQFEGLMIDFYVQDFITKQRSQKYQDLYNVTGIIHVSTYNYLIFNQVQMPFSAPKVKALGVILTNKFGAKLYSKYYTKHTTTDFSKTEFDINTEPGKLKLQKTLIQKLKKMNVISTMDLQKSEIFSLSGYTVVIKVVHQLLIFLLCEEQENFVLMENVINCIGKVLPMITSEQYVQKTIEDNLDSIIICVDQVIDQGIILCLDQNQVFDRMKMREGSQRVAAGSGSASPTKKATQQQTTSTFNSFFGFAKNTLQKTLNLG